jgi:arylformamidase
LNFSRDNSWFDLSHQISPSMQTFPVFWHRKVEFVQLGTLHKDGRNTTHVHIGTHSGTHIDAPSHFIQDGASISEFSLDRFHGNALIVDLTNVKPREEVRVALLENVLNSHQGEYDAILLNFNWSRFYGSAQYYSDQPYLSNESMEFLCSLNPSIIGYDLAMPDNPKDGYGSDCDSPMHKLALGKNILLLENLLLPLSLANEIELVAFPLNLLGLDGSPVRAVGRVRN